MDQDSLMQFVYKALGDNGAMMNGSLVVIGDRLGLYRALAGAGPTTAAELADETGTSERYIREWMGSQAANGYLDYDGDGRFSLPEEQAVVLTDETSPVCAIGIYQTALAAVHSVDRLTEAFRTGEGIGWGEHDHDLYPGCERLFRPSYLNYLTSEWIPALDSIEDRLRAGAAVADIGCGHGASTLIMAEAYPESVFTGFDAHPGSVEGARKRAVEAGLADRVKFVVGTAKEFPGSYDLVTFFDCLHDMGDPAGTCAHVRSALAPQGAAMFVEPAAGDRIEDNLNPVGAVYYAASTHLCTPSSMSQEVATALGSQAGEARLREVITGAGLSRVRRVADTPFNMVLEARP